MITITIKMKTKEYMSKIDRLFIEATHMNKVAEGKYESDQDVLMNCYDSAEQLMKRKWFRDNVLSMIWKVDEDDEGDLVKHFTQRIAQGKVNVIS